MDGNNNKIDYSNGSKEHVKFFFFLKTFIYLYAYFILKQSDNEGINVCSRCQIYRPAGSHHCKICKRCIRKRHHHCQW